MKRSEVKVGGIYLAKVNNTLTNVRLDGIRSVTKMRAGKLTDGEVFDVTNLATGRTTVFDSAAKFRSEVKTEVKPEQFQILTQPIPELEKEVKDGSGWNVAEAVSSTLSQRLATAIPAKPLDDAPHLIVEARAGTGKTTTLVGGLKVLKGIDPGITPSPQQQKVWDCIALSKGKAQSVCFVAFNKSIATELAARVPQGCDAMTMHSMGFRAVTKAFGRCEPNQWALTDLIADTLGRDARELKKNDATLLMATEELVELCKLNLVGFGPNGQRPGEDFDWIDELDSLCEHYGVECNGSKARVYDLVPKVLAKCLEVKGRITFTDMIWLPVVLNLPVTRYDLLMVDEAQDLNRAQQALAKMAGRRLILCGDPKQAIYGFAGADARSMARMGEELEVTDRGCKTLPLTVTRRCGKAIVKEANRFVEDFGAFETNPEGQVRSGLTFEGAKCYRSEVQDGDFVLCRTNAPLVSQCFKFIRAGRKANIQGRDIGKGLISTVNKLKADNVADLISKLGDWLSAETRKEEAKKFPSETRIQGLQDRYDCLICFTDGVDPNGSPELVTRKIDAVFTDDKKSPGVKFSSIHRSKGLEAHRVYILKPKSGPRRDKMKGWELEQEDNLCYVSITRAIETLTYVYEEK